MKKNNLSKLEHIKKQLKLAKKTVIKVGVPADVGVYKNGQTIAEVGTYQEYGLGVPRRSFLRMPFKVKEKEIKKVLKIGYKSVLKGSDTIVTLNKIGIVVQNIVKDAFKTSGYGTWKPLKKSTIKEKKSSKILIDTGRLVQSVTFWVVKDD